MIDRSFPIKSAPQVVKIPPLLTVHAVFLEMHQHVLRILRCQIAQQLIEGSAPDKRISASKCIVCNSCDL